MRVKFATVAAAVLLAALLVNHWWIGVQVARISAAVGRPLGAPNDFGVDLPGYLKFLVKLDHLAERYGYVLISLAWVAAFVVASIGLGLRDFLGGPKPSGIPED
jgi:hypothetical protein